MRRSASGHSPADLVAAFYNDPEPKVVEILARRFGVKHLPIPEDKNNKGVKDHIRLKEIYKHLKRLDSQYRTDPSEDGRYLRMARRRLKELIRIWQAAAHLKALISEAHWPAMQLEEKVKRLYTQIGDDPTRGPSVENLSVSKDRVNALQDEASRRIFRWKVALARAYLKAWLEWPDQYRRLPDNRYTEWLREIEDEERAWEQQELSIVAPGILKHDQNKNAGDRWPEAPTKLGEAPWRHFLREASKQDEDFKAGRLALNHGQGRHYDRNYRTTALNHMVKMKFVTTNGLQGNRRVYKKTGNFPQL